MSDSIDELKTVIGGVVDKIEERIKILEEKEKRWAEVEKKWAEVEKKMQEHADTAAQKIVLDIGGQRFATSKTTLLQAGDSFFHAMLSSGKWKPDADGSYFIDRNPELFPVILDYLRMGKLSLKKCGDAVEDLKAELDFYQIQIPEELFSSAPTKEPAKLNGAFGGSKILNKDQKKKLHEWLGNKNATLQYLASRDGFGAAQFHQLCDNKGPTITVIRSTQGYIFGGYTDQTWESSSKWKTGVNWIFSLTNPSNITTQFFHTGGACGTFCGVDRGPTFGGGHDIYVADNSNSNTSSNTSFPYSYQDTTGKGNIFFTGANNFQTNEIEVFLVQ